MAVKPRGLTLIELLITIILLSVLLGAIWMVYNTGFKTFYGQFTRSGVKGEAGRAFINIPQELRLATSITSAQQSSLSFTLDSDGDGVDETVQYAWSGAAGDALERTLTSTYPYVNSVSNLACSYYDVDNNLLNFPVTASQVRGVAIDLTVADKDEIFQLRTRIKLRSI